VYGSPVIKDQVFELPSSGTSSESPVLDSGGVASTGEVSTHLFSDFKPPRSPVRRRERKPKRARIEVASSSDGGVETAPPRQTQFDRVQAILLRLTSFALAKATQGTWYIIQESIRVCKGIGECRRRTKEENAQYESTRETEEQNFVDMCKGLQPGSDGKFELAQEEEFKDGVMAAVIFKLQEFVWLTTGGNQYSETCEVANNGHGDCMIAEGMNSHIWIHARIFVQEKWIRCNVKLQHSLFLLQKGRGNTTRFAELFAGRSQLSHRCSCELCLQLKHFDCQTSKDNNRRQGACFMNTFH